MGFNSVYKALQDVFPQVDSRILRAVAIEHSKDADIAVEVVLAEVIPRLSAQSLRVGSSNGSNPSPSLSEDGGKTAQLEATMNPGDINSCLSEQSTEAGPSNIEGSLSGAKEDADSSDQPSSPTVFVTVTLAPLGISSFHDANGKTDTDSDGLPILLENFGDNSNSNNPDRASHVLICESGLYDNHDQESLKTGGEIAASLTKSVTSGDGVSGSIQVEASLQLDVTTPTTNDEYTHLHVDPGTIIASPSSHLDIFPTSSVVTLEIAAPLTKSVTSGDGVSGSIQVEASLQSDVTTPIANDEYKHPHGDPETIIALPSDHLDIFPTRSVVTPEYYSSSSSKTVLEKDDSAIAIVNPEDESILTSMLTRSDQNCSTEFLEDIIEDAKNNKKTLVSAMDSVVNLMKEVEIKERTAEQAKEEAARGCLDILAKVDELKQTLRRAKEANDMHAGEVYAEKAILATELKELQFRLFNLSEEKNRSLGILHEMRKTLEVRLTTALKELEAAETEKLEKEQSAREALAYQESQMEKVVEESKKLQLEAEENSKLQEFLMDRGRAIDILQGEISVKCQDVLLLKEKFDKRIPLSHSLSSSQTSSILASSSSSFRSITPPHEPEPEAKPEPEPETHGTPNKGSVLGDSYGSLEKRSRLDLPQSHESLTETVYSIDDNFPTRDDPSDDRKMLLEDGWELFDNGELSTDR